MRSLSFLLVKEKKASHSLNLRLGEAVRPQTVTVRRQGKVGTPNESGRAASNALAKQSPQPGWSQLMALHAHSTRRG